MPLASTILALVLMGLISQSSQDKLRRHYEAAEAQRSAGNLAAAENEFASILAEGYQRLARIYSARKGYREAVNAMEAAAVYRPESEEVLLDLAIAYFEAQEFKKALEPLHRILARNLESAGAHHMAGKTYFMLRDAAKAAIELEIALKLAPDDSDIAYTLGLAYLRERELAPAQRVYGRMLEQLGDKPQVHILFGRAYREAGFLVEAIDEFKKALAFDPNYPRAHYYLGLTYLLNDGASRRGEAREEFKAELAAHPNEFFAHYYLGIVYLYDRDWKLAINSLERASQIQPDSPDPYFHLGQAYQGLDQHVLAVEALRKTIALNPRLEHNEYQVTTAHYRLGQSLLKIGQTEAGKNELQLASKLKAEAIKRVKDSYSGAGESREINPDLLQKTTAENTMAKLSSREEGVKSAPESGEAFYEKVVATAHNSIGLLRAEQQDFRGAVTQFGLAAKWNPQQEGLNYNLGLAYFKSAMYEEAVAPLERELKAHPENSPARQLLELSNRMLKEKTNR